MAAPPRSPIGGRHLAPFDLRSVLVVEPHVCPFRLQPLCGTFFPCGGESSLDRLRGITRIDWIRGQRRFRRVGVQHPMRRRILSGLLIC